LVVDDQVSNTRLMKLFLEKAGDYVVREENDALAALSTADEFQPHLILLDMKMPRMDGGELAACLQGNPKLKGVPIVFLTGSVTREQIAENGALRKGIPFLAKPVVLDEVLACIKHHLGGVAL
jgi:CheY-like chemotaxis protein